MSTSHAVSETSFTLKLFVGFLKFKVNWASYSLPGKSDKDLKVEKKFPNCVKLCEFKLRAESGSLTCLPCGVPWRKHDYRPVTASLDGILQLTLSEEWTGSQEAWSAMHERIQRGDYCNRLMLHDKADGEGCLLIALLKLEYSEPVEVFHIFHNLYHPHATNTHTNTLSSFSTHKNIFFILSIKVRKYILSC